MQNTWRLSGRGPRPRCSPSPVPCSCGDTDRTIIICQGALNTTFCSSRTGPPDHWGSPPPLFCQLFAEGRQRITGNRQCPQSASGASGWRASQIGRMTWTILGSWLCFWPASRRRGRRRRPLPALGRYCEKISHTELWLLIFHLCLLANAWVCHDRYL